MSRQKERGSYTGMEDQIIETLERRAESVQVTSGDTERMKRRVHRKIEEDVRMRRWSAGKIVVVAAAVCLMGSITAVAAGKITQTMSASSHADDFPYSQLASEEKKVGIITKAPEAFSNGYRFDTGVPVKTSDMDQDGNVVDSGTELSLNYKKDGQPDLFISVGNTAMYQGEQPGADQVFDHNGVSISFKADHYRIVPEGYQVSAEEQAEVDAGKLVISYGSDKVTDQMYQSVIWQQDGKTYSISGFDTTLTGAEMAQMAGEIIDAK